MRRAFLSAVDRAQHFPLSISNYADTMLRALGQLLLRGAVSLAGAALTALCIAGVLSLVATHFPTKKQAVAETIALKNGCVPSRCGTRNTEHQRE
ncbi:hypothetical protein ABIB83_004668 [Bradyrhizobium sp. I1.8.5]|uniref:hypothetical protein n=1 Tax=Bradyrhizobium sp. I1.8.5 TaxID=3156365 RepID=UPI0033944074